MQRVFSRSRSDVKYGDHGYVPDHLMERINAGYTNDALWLLQAPETAGILQEETAVSSSQTNTGRWVYSKQAQSICTFFSP